MTPDDFNRIADVLPEPMLLVTVRGRVAAVNQTLRQMLGTAFVTGRQYDVSEIFRTPGEQIKEYLRLCSGVRQFLPGALKFHFYSTAELDLRCEGVGVDGSTSSEPLILLRLKSKTAAVERFQALNEQIELLNDEIGKRIKAEEANRRSEEIMRQQTSLFDQAYDAIFVWQWNGPITFWNRGAERLYGFSRTNALGQISHKLLNTRTARGMDQLLLDLGSQGQWEGELEHITRDRHAINVETRMVLVRETAGAYVLEVNRDITARKRAQQELEESVRREKTARELAEKASLAKDDFLASLSHELRTPLNPVLLIASDAAENPELAPEVRNNFETIRKNIELEARLIDDLLDLTRIAHGKLSLQFRLIDAAIILHEAIANIQSDANVKQIQVLVNWSAEPSTVSGDDVRLQQVFWNVLKNAVKFTPPHGKITVEATVTKGQLSVSFTDTGIGMTPEEINRVFDAFSQGDHVGNETHRFGGLGLGLAISRQLIKMHRGQIYAHSAGRDQGSTFTIELPLAKKDILSSVSPDPSNPHVMIFSSEQNARILLVEDHEPTRNTLAHLLTRRQYKVLAACCAAEARDISAREKVDLVISDVGLPDGNGNELMKELRERFGLKGIALTGYGMEHDIEHSLASGFVTHLIKPVNVRSLEKALEEFKSS
ncbi:MAG TPA: ATP-binding protein [Candidatus Acidoferrum sp.]|jgi:PAS domain S-box-containing protein|nr:ATP-binding protein [Candidatus Acidoferrum sp.]